VDDPPSNHESDSLGTAEPDPESLKELETLLALTTDYASWPQAIRSRVLMDMWHAMARIKVPKEHGFWWAFAIALRDAIFIPNAENKTHITAYLHSKNSSSHDLLGLSMQNPCTEFRVLAVQVGLNSDFTRTSLGLGMEIWQHLLPTKVLVKSEQTARIPCGVCAD
jgi:hypothetical protein